MNEARSKIAIVTGGSSGIGLAISRELAKSGMDLVIVNDVNIDEGERVAEQLSRDFGVRTMHMRGDVSNEQDVDNVFQKAMESFGAIDVLVNDAGVVDDAFIDKMDSEKWRRVLEVNLTGTFYCTRAAMRFMKEQGSGRILNISSVSAEIGNIGQANYVASKGGVIALTRTVAREGARHGIIVNAIAPGFINTRMTSSIRADIVDKIIAQIPMKRFGEPEEVAKLARFLVSEENTYITGQIININGGMYS